MSMAPTNLRLWPFSYVFNILHTMYEKNVVDSDANSSKLELPYQR